MRAVQAEGTKGSLKWIQCAVEHKSSVIEEPILSVIPNATTIEWRSPIRSDGFAEYRDGAFLKLLGLDDLTESLADFWPRGGPQWDALGITDSGQILLVEAKAHIGEFCSPASQASAPTLAKIKAALGHTAAALGVSKHDASRWHEKFYQYANRLAHLVWLRERGVNAYLCMMNFWGDSDMPGHPTPEAWEAAYQVAEFALGLSRRHKYSPFMIHLTPDVSSI